MDESPLSKIFRATQEIRTLMESDAQLDRIDQLCLENCMAMLQMTYIEWKRRNIPPDPPYWGSALHEGNQQDQSYSSRAS